MSSEAAVPTINVSLEDHLAESLRPLLAILPEHLAVELKDVLDPTHAIPRLTSNDSEASECAVIRTIPYVLLAAISKWARTPGAALAMSDHAPPLRIQDYTMIALLAGTHTSPERKFPVVSTPFTDSQASRSREVGDRRAVTAVINALLSVGGSGVATWWAAGRLLWREEWKVLLALSVAVLVAASEIVLYLIWENQRNNLYPHRAMRLHGAVETKENVPTLENKKRDTDTDRPCEAHEANDGFMQTGATTTAMSTHQSGSSKDTLHARTKASASLHVNFQKE